jgi:hypothetical protein
VRYACIEEHRASYDVTMMCRVLEVARSGYYKWRACSGGERRVGEMRLLLEIRAAHQQSRGRYGAPRIWRELRERGVACSRGQVERLMRQDRLRGKSNRPQRRRKVVEEQAVGLVAENLLARRFSPEDAGGLNRVWVSDITYIPTRQGWLYLVLILDLASRRVVGWAMGAAQNTALVLDALEMAVQSRRPAPGLILHSDQGWPVHEPSVSGPAGEARDAVQHEPARHLSGQRRGRERLRDAGVRADRRSRLAHARRSSTGRLRVPGGVVQPEAQPPESLNSCVH